MELARVLLESWADYARTHRPTKEELGEIRTKADALDREYRLQVEWGARPEPQLSGLSPARYLAERTTGEDWVQLLTDWAEVTQGDRELLLPLVEAVRSRLGELGPTIAGLIGNEALWGERSPGRGYAPALAARLLGDLRYEGAVAPLLRALEKTSELTALGDEAIGALREIGEPAREGLYDVAERYRHNVDSTPYARAVEVLSGLPKDERTWQYLRQGFSEANEMIGLYIVLAGDYGDKRAAYHLNALLEERGTLTADDRRECLESLELLGGIPTARARAAAYAAPEEASVPGKVGRNDPCPCGSGKKYKKCCGK